MTIDNPMVPVESESPKALGALRLKGLQPGALGSLGPEPLIGLSNKKNARLHIVKGAFNQTVGDNSACNSVYDHNT